MALSTGAIAEVSSLNNNIANDSVSYCDRIKNTIEELEGNGEFQKFIAGTELGQNMFNQLKQLSEQLELLRKQQSSLHSETSSFLSRQTRINSLK